jgi:hypothetical protein
MLANNISNFSGVWSHFEHRILPLLQDAGRTAVVWEEAFRHVSNLPLGTLVEVWTGPGKVQLALNAGMDVLLAYGWFVSFASIITPPSYSCRYLDRQVPVENYTG